MIAEIAEALSHAHSEGFIHRDIKPANILLDQGGRPHLTDFGIASTIEEISAADNSGTLAYMAPEQVADEKHLIGPATDIYSLDGVLLSAEYIDGGELESKQSIPIREWSHIAATFGEKETRLYFNGKFVQTGPPTKSVGGTPFVIGNVGQSNPIDFFLGQIRSIRISRGARFTEDFIPEKHFGKDDENHPNKAVLIYDGSSNDGDRVTDLSGEENHGVWEHLNP